MVVSLSLEELEQTGKQPQQKNIIVKRISPTQDANWPRFNLKVLSSSIPLSRFFNYIFFSKSDFFKLKSITEFHTPLQPRNLLQNMYFSSQSGEYVIPRRPVEWKAYGIPWHNSGHSLLPLKRSCTCLQPVDPVWGIEDDISFLSIVLIHFSCENELPDSPLLRIPACP